MYSLTKKKIALLLLLPFIGCSSSSVRNVTDHCNGRKFYNPTLTDQISPGFKDVFRMIKQGRSKWPKSVDNVAEAKLNINLNDDDIAITFINHATFLIQMGGLNILTDPVWSLRASPVNWFGPKRIRKPGVKIDELPDIDIILISHNHYDHLDVETIKKLHKRFAPKFLVPLGDKDLLNRLGINDVQELDWWESVIFSHDAVITFTPAQHSSGRGFFDRDKSLWGSYLIKRKKQSVYFGGDSGYSTHYSDIKNRLGAPDIALLGIGSYAPRWFMKPLHMNPNEGVIAHKDLGAKVSIGMHFGTFQLSSEPFSEHRELLRKALKNENIPDDNFLILDEGETRIFGE